MKDQYMTTPIKIENADGRKNADVSVITERHDGEAWRAVETAPLSVGESNVVHVHHGQRIVIEAGPDRLGGSVPPGTGDRP